MCVTLSAKAEAITNTTPKTWDVRTGPSRGSPLDSGPLGEHTQPRGAEQNKRNITEGARPDAKDHGLTQANLKRLEDRDPLAAILALARHFLYLVLHDDTHQRSSYDLGCGPFSRCERFCWPKW